MLSWFSSLFRRKKHASEEADKKNLQSPQKNLTEGKLAEVQEIDSESFNKLIKEKFMNQNVTGDKLVLDSNKFELKIDENQTDARSLQSFDKSSSGSASEDEMDEDNFSPMEL